MKLVVHGSLRTRHHHERRNTINLTAEGPAESISARATEIQRWFDGAEFAALAGELPGKTAMLHWASY